MIRSRLVYVFAAILTGVALMPSPVALADASPNAKEAPSGVYQLDPNHASVTFKINHLGFSRYTARFDKMEGTLNFNSDAPEQSSLNITVYPNSIDANNAKLEEELRGDNWFNVIKFPRATFQTTKIERTSPTTGKITGDFTFLGVTHQLTLDTTLVGVGMHPMMHKPVLGFSATGTFRRSDFGMQNLLPMVGDEVTLQIEAEFDKAE